VSAQAQKFPFLGLLFVGLFQRYFWTCPSAAWNFHYKRGPSSKGKIILEYGKIQHCEAIKYYRDQGIQRAEDIHERERLKIKVIQLLVMCNFYLEFVLNNMSS
jgi:hypothetical protein